MLWPRFASSVLLTFLLSLLAVSAAQAHFVFVIPQTDGAHARVIMSETLKPDDRVDAIMLKDLELSIRDNTGKVTSLTLGPEKDNALTLELPGSGTRVVHGQIDLGYSQRGSSKPHVLIYYPKAIVGDAFDAAATMLNHPVIELIPVGKVGAVRFQLNILGKPAADTKVVVVLPDNTEEMTETGPDGRTQAFTQMGTYGAWARFWQDAPGERDGKKYDQLRHYATLVATVSQADATPAVASSTNQAATQPAATQPAPKTNQARYAPLPEPLVSMGAVASEGYLYVYGGHRARTHHYDTDAVSPHFYRMNLDEGKTWEKLPDGPAVQGMNIAAYKGKIYRLGGMEPRNVKGEKTANYSIDEAAVFDPSKGVPAQGKWEALPSLPAPRSSFDVVAMNDKLYVLGGWNMNAKTGDEWYDTGLVLDLKKKNAKWKSVKQPFSRRALIMATHDKKIYVMGGMDKEDSISQDVNIFNPVSGKWSYGPDLPGDMMNGFSPAAVEHNGKLYVSVFDGTLYRLNDAASKWEQVLLASPRIVHRLVSHGDDILIIGGAPGGGKPYDSIETVTIHPDGSGTLDVIPQKPESRKTQTRG